MSDTAAKYALIGAGPMGLAMARNLQRLGIPFQGFELHEDVGGLWNIDNPHSTMYESAHLISSKRMTEFSEFPMAEEVADYPHHRDLCQYFRAFADHFDLRSSYRFGTRVIAAERTGDGWRIDSEQRIDSSGEAGGEIAGETNSERRSEHFRGLLIANGTLSEPNLPTFEGQFSGQILHSADYRSAKIFEDQRVLIVGAGNSGCDIAVDAVHHASQVLMSVRRGYHFVPKYVFGRPADSIGGKINLPRFIKQRIDRALLSWFNPDPLRLGFPAPDHKLYESHPIVNSLVLHHLGHGDIKVMADVARFDGNTVHFRNGETREVDIVLLATGYQLHYPFVGRDELNWQGASPHLYLNCFHPQHDDIFVLGMVEAAGLGWQGRYEQAELVARYLQHCQAGSAQAEKFRQLKEEPFPDMRGGWSYLELDRMSYYVHKDTYRNTVRRHIRELS